MKKIFVDIYLAFNLGDDLFLDILVKKYPEAEFTVNYVGKDYDQFISNYNNVRRRKYTTINKIMQRLNIKECLRDYSKIAEEHDALVFIGGSIFREEDYHKSLYEDRMNMVKEFKKREKSVFVLGANFGPIKTNEFIDDYKYLFSMCDDICFRDLYSYDIFKELPQVRYAPDIVFQMSVDEYKYNEKKKIVGFSIIDVKHKQGLAKYENEYIVSTVKSIELLIDKGYECYLMSFCEREGDFNVIKTIESQLSKQAKSKVIIYEYKGQLKEAINLISTFELFIAARFHANIMGLLLGIGILPIIYSEKTTNMLKYIGKDNILINMANLELQHNEEIIELAINNKSNLSKIKKDSENQFLKLANFLLEKNNSNQDLFMEEI